MSTPTNPLAHPDVFVRRHIGPSPEEQSAMLKAMGLASLDTLVSETVPQAIRMAKPLALPARLLLSYAGVGVLVGLHWLTFYGAIKLSNASIAATCMALRAGFRGCSLVPKNCV